MALPIQKAPGGHQQNFLSRPLSPLTSPACLEPNCPGSGFGGCPTDSRQVRQARRSRPHRPRRLSRSGWRAATRRRKTIPRLLRSAVLPGPEPSAAAPHIPGTRLRSAPQGEGSTPQRPHAVADDPPSHSPCTRTAERHINPETIIRSSGNPVSHKWRKLVHAFTATRY